MAERKKSTKKEDEVVADLPEESTPIAVSVPEISPDSIDISVADVSIPVSATTDGDDMYTRRHTGVANSPEPSALLTDERLLDIKEKLARPEGWWQSFVYTITFHTVNLGDSRKARARMPKAKAALIETEQSALTGFTSEEKQLLVTLLQRIVRNLETGP